jgi:hypothetical protein
MLTRVSLSQFFKRSKSNLSTTVTSPHSQVFADTPPYPFQEFLKEPVPDVPAYAGPAALEAWVGTNSPIRFYRLNSCIGDEGDVLPEALDKKSSASRRPSPILRAMKSLFARKSEPVSISPSFCNSCSTMSQIRDREINLVVCSTGMTVIDNPPEAVSVGTQVETLLATLVEVKKVFVHALVGSDEPLPPLTPQYPPSDPALDAFRPKKKSRFEMENITDLLDLDSVEFALAMREAEDRHALETYVVDVPCNGINCCENDVYHRSVSQRGSSDGYFSGIDDRHLHYSAEFDYSWNREETYSDFTISSMVVPKPSFMIRLLDAVRCGVPIHPRRQYRR